MTENNRLDRQLQFLNTIDALKEVIRKSYLMSCSRRENTAEHSWHAALGVLLLAEYAEEQVDIERCIKMMLVHDLVEVYAGDTYIYLSLVENDQAKRESEAADRLFGLLPEDQAAELRQLWEEFESLATPEARFCKSIDRLMPLLLNFGTYGRSWRENNVHAGMVTHITARIKPGSSRLWEYAEALKRDAVKLGYLYPEPGNKTT